MPGFPVTEVDAKSSWFGTFRGRVGRHPTTFTYVTGGLAYGEIRRHQRCQRHNLVGRGASTASRSCGRRQSSNSTIKLGWTVGFGVERHVGQLDGKVEYLYVDSEPSRDRSPRLVTPAGNNLYVGYSSHVTDNIVRAGVNYQFH